MSTIERSPGVPVSVGVIGAMVGRGTGLPTLDPVVANAANLLHERFEMPVTIRFNSDGESGGAWLKTHERDRIGANAEIGISAEIITQRRVDVIEDMRKRHNEDWWPNMPPVGTILIYAYLSARVGLYPDLFHGERYVMLPVRTAEDALTLVSAAADLSLVDFESEA